MATTVALALCQPTFIGTVKRFFHYAGAPTKEGIVSECTSVVTPEERRWVGL
jgi:hypothetical protein